MTDWSLYLDKNRHIFSSVTAFEYEQRFEKTRQIFMGTAANLACVRSPISLNASTGGMTTVVNRVSCVISTWATTVTVSIMFSSRDSPRNFDVHILLEFSPTYIYLHIEIYRVCCNLLFITWHGNFKTSVVWIPVKYLFGYRILLVWLMVGSTWSLPRDIHSFVQLLCLRKSSPWLIQGVRRIIAVCGNIAPPCGKHHHILSKWDIYGVLV